MKLNSYTHAVLAAFTTSLFFLSHTNFALSTIKTINSEQEFNELITNNPAALVELFASYCGTCQQVKPIFESVAALPEFSSITFARIDIETMEEFAKAHNIEAIPTWWYFKDGAKVHEEAGAKDISTFANYLSKQIRSLLLGTRPVTQTPEQLGLLDEPSDAGQQPSDSVQVGILDRISLFFQSIIQTIKDLIARFFALF